MWIDDPKWISRLKSQPVDLEAVLDRVLAAVAEDLDAERATLFLHDEVRGELVGRIGSLPEVAEIHLRVGEGVAGFVAERGEPMVVPDAQASEELARRIDLETGYRTRTLLTVPIFHEERLLGVLQALNHRPGPFDALHLPGGERWAERIARLLADTSLRDLLSPDRRGPLVFRFNGIVGSSAAMRAALDRAARAAATDATVLIRGESGTGKGLVARAVHVNSPRRDGPFVTIDCAALPADLIENELFGHVRGAFTGADREAPGKVEGADGGTLFLDEIGDLPGAVQGKLLRLVQERRWFPVGGTTERTADVRLVTATRRDLEAQVADGRLREDLYYRLRVVEVELPPLRARGHAELDQLIDHLLARAAERHGRRARLGSDARRALHGRAWRGNVRELEHCLEAAVVLSPGPLIRPESLPAERRGPRAETAEPVAAADVRPLREVERTYCLRAVEACGGNRTEAARRLEIGRNTLARKLDG